MSLNEVYEKYKHLDGLLSNPIDNASINLTARDLWLAVKEAAQHSVQSDLLPCGHSVDSLGGFGGCNPNGSCMECVATSH